MRASEFLTEAQLDEINRRDFMKGAGAACVAGAAGGMAGCSEKGMPRDVKAEGYDYAVVNDTQVGIYVETRDDLMVAFHNIGGEIIVEFSARGLRMYKGPNVLSVGLDNDTFKLLKSGDQERSLLAGTRYDTSEGFLTAVNKAQILTVGNNGIQLNTKSISAVTGQ